MTGAQRRIVLAVCVIVGLTLLVAAGLTFLVAPMAEGLGLSDEFVEDALVVPAVASLLVVFIAGRAGDRFGQRRTMIAAGLAFTLGSLVLAGAQGPAAVDLGLALCGAGAIVIQVVAVSLLQRTASEGSAHVSAFTSYGMVFPIAFLVLPIATAGLLGSVGWRWIPITWAVAGLAIAILARTMLDRSETSKSSGEWITPILAGISLAAGATVISEIDNIEIEGTRLAIGALLSVIAAIACLIIMRGMDTATFSFRPLRGPMMRALMLGVVLISLVQLLTYVCIVLEYFYDLTALEAAIIVAPAQLGAILGAKFLAGRVVRRYGTARAGRLLMLFTGLTMLPLVVMQTSTPMWLLVAISSVFSFAGMGALTVLNMDVMGRAPADRTGEVSAFRTAASSIGTALGMALLGAIIISSVQMDTGADAVSDAQLQALAAALRIDGVLSFLIACVGWAILARAERVSAR